MKNYVLTQDMQLDIKITMTGVGAIITLQIQSWQKFCFNFANGKENMKHS